METGKVMSFQVNARGGFGFLKMPGGGDDVYFQRDDGGPVDIVNGRQQIQTWRAVRQPRQGDVILFEWGFNNQGKKAAPWCFKEEWDEAETAISLTCPTYQLVRQAGHRTRGRRVPQTMWQGRCLAEVEEQFGQDIHLTTHYHGDDFEIWWFERLADGTANQWERCDDPRTPALVSV